jgi:hypothetical protein
MPDSLPISAELSPSDPTPTPATPEEPTPMLDVHPAHHAANTWRDFFTHIATIVLGLCIAVGLEQTVEFFHHRYQVAETREDLRVEREDNHRLFARYVQDFHWETAALENDMMVLDYLQQHPGTPQEKLPGYLSWRWARANFNHVAWDSARQASITALMPQSEITRYAQMYEELQIATDTDDETWIAINNARRYTFHDSDPSHLTSAQLAEEIELVKTALMDHYNHGIAMDHIPGRFPGFPAGISDADMNQLPHYPDPQTLKTLAPARALTDERLKAAGFVPRVMTPDGWAPAPTSPEKK